MVAPLVSILMPTLNSERTIEMALSAIRRQTLGRDAGRDSIEILIADGGSTDATRAIAKAHGAIILENEKVLPEYGLNVAMTAARGSYGLMLGSDEILQNEDSLAIKVRLLRENPHVHNVMFGGFRVPDDFPPISHYWIRFGDPFSHFMHRIDMGDMWRELFDRFELVRDEPDYRVFRLGSADVMPVCDDGHFFCLDYLRTVADQSDISIIPRLINVMTKEHRQVAVVKNDFMVHHSTADYETAKKKIEWKIVGNIHHVDSGSIGYASREELQPRGFKWKKYLFIPYALSIAAPAIDAARLAARYRNPGMLYHLPLAVGAGLSIVKHSALRALGVKVEHKAYGK